MQFVVFAPNQWQGQWMNRQQIFSRIGQKHPTVYSNGAWYSWQRHEQEYANAPWFGALMNQDNIHEVQAPRLLLRLEKLKWLDLAVIKLFSRFITGRLTNTSPTCLYIFHPCFQDYVPIIKHDLLVYHVYDDYSKQGDYDQKMAVKEIQLVADADLVFTSSRHLRQHLRSLSARDDIEFLPNGVNYHQFATQQPEPKDLQTIPRPRIGYTGSINKKVDLELLCELAEALPDKQFVLIGNIGKIDDHQALRSLEKCSNVHFLGSKDVSQISAYMQHMNINIMSYKTGDKTWAPSIYPLKLHEYLATGQPVISSAIDAVTEFSDVVSIAQDTRQWIDLIQHHLTNPGNQEERERRQRVAAQNTWEKRVEVIIAKISERIAEKSPRK